MSAETAEVPPQLTNPILRWGTPLGKFQLELVDGGAMFTVHTTDPTGGPILLCFPMTNVEIGEMKALIDMLEFDAAVLKKIKAPHGRIATMGNG